MKIILTLYSQKFPEKMKRKSEDLYRYAKEKKLELCRGFVFDYDQENKLFKRALFFDKNRWIWRKNIKPDSVYDRSLTYIKPEWQKFRAIIEKDFPFFNNLELGELLTNKWFAYKKFKKFCPSTVFVKNKEDLKKIKQLKSKKVILKPLSGTHGLGIKISEKKQMRPIDFPFIAQEFIFTKKGMSGFVSGPHDLRVVVANEEIIHSFLRIPPKGKLIANTLQGGSLKVVPINKLPENINRVLKSVLSQLKKYTKKLFSVDFIFDDKQRPWILELNSRPSIILDKEEMKCREYYYKHLTNFFLAG